MERFIGVKEIKALKMTRQEYNDYRGWKLPPFNPQGTYRKVNDRTAKFIGEDKPLNCQPYFAMYNAQEEWIPGWLASQSDMLDEDWFIVE